MKISELIGQLKKIKKQEGDIEVTCTATALSEDEQKKAFSDVWESTVENLVVRDGGNLGKRVRLYL